jgi:pimeloyl-ACP methyl ester carboxylesterase
LLAAVAAVAGVVGLTSASYQQFADRRDRRRFPPPGRLVEIGGGRRLHLLAKGAGPPNVVVVPALGDCVLPWAGIQRELASEMRVCLYDRAGTGWSDPPRRGTRTFDDMAAELHDLLRAAGIAPPYVLVGHSIGGIVVRRFAACYPAAVAGLALIDSSQEDQASRHGVAGYPLGPAVNLRLALKWQARVLGVRRLIAGLGLAHELDAEVASEVPAEFAGEGRAIYLSSRYRRVVVRELLMLARPAGRPPVLGSLPLTVVTAGRRVPGWMEMQEELASLSSDSSHVVADGAGHLVQTDDPEFVVQVIRDLARRAMKYCGPRADVTASTEADLLS